MDATAASAGLAPGQALTAARAQVPDLVVDRADPVADTQALTRLAAWCGKYSPWTAPDGGHDAGGGAGILIDATGCAHLFGGEAAMLADIYRRITALGLSARAAMAGTPGAAWALARFGTQASTPTRIVSPGAENDALAPLPPAALRLSAAERELLHRLGLRCVGDLLAIAPAALSPRVGRGVARRLDQALGRIAEPINPCLPVPALRVRRNFAEPLTIPDDLARASASLLAKLVQRLEAEQRGVRRIELAGYRMDGTWTRLEIGTHRASRDRDHLAPLLTARADELDPGVGIETLVLAATAVEALPAQQAALPGYEAPTDDLANLLDRLGTRLGSDAISRPAPWASHLPERSVRRLGPFETTSLAWPTTAHRPLRLLTRLRPIEAATPRPGDPPTELWLNRQRLAVVRSEAPERLTSEWWRTNRQRATRDYFRIETEAGRRYWIVHAKGRWYLHGLYA
ncbi:Y-family DNA polymerase [Rhodovibrio salinarum]|uniref:Protein ImuB n=1 Tax=Rhodovibrio salinarum TaxID=1087 RepID=A0A934QGA1_9PROT|nr:DNA polymerase Y family protein [Rhodovibrio salinarum]MBK1696234.1 hypothetical protein [Rhodovibrio salinarum]